MRKRSSRRLKPQKDLREDSVTGSGVGTNTGVAKRQREEDIDGDDGLKLQPKVKIICVGQDGNNETYVKGYTKMVDQKKPDVLRNNNSKADVPMRPKRQTRCGTGKRERLSKKKRQCSKYREWYHVNRVTGCNGRIQKDAGRSVTEVLVLKSAVGDLEGVGNERLVLSRMSTADVDEMKLQVKRETIHKKTENIMPRVMQLSKDQIEMAYSCLVKQWNTTDGNESISEDVDETEEESENEQCEKLENPRWGDDTRSRVDHCAGLLEIHDNKLTVVEAANDILSSSLSPCAAFDPDSDIFQSNEMIILRKARCEGISEGQASESYGEIDSGLVGQKVSLPCTLEGRHLSENCEKQLKDGCKVSSSVVKLASPAAGVAHRLACTELESGQTVADASERTMAIKDKSGNASTDENKECNPTLQLSLNLMKRKLKTTEEFDRKKKKVPTATLR